MSFLFLKTKQQKIFFLLCIVLQILFTYSIYQSNDFFIEILTNKKIILLIFFQFLISFIFFSIFFKKYFFLANFFFSLMLINFLTTPFFSLQPSFITLKPNIKKQIIINTNVMPGFNDISKISTDYKGFRTTKKINYNSKDKNIYRVFMIGGSTMEQIFLDDNKTSSALIEEMLESAIKSKKIEVINAGVSGLRSEHHYATFSQILKYSPDLVIFMMGINDMNRDINEFVKNDETKKKEVSSVTTMPLEFTNIKRSFDFSKSLLWMSFKNLSDIIIFSFYEKDLNFTNSPQYEDGEYYSKQNNSLTRKIKKKINIEEVSVQYQFWVDRIIKLCNLNKNTKCLFVNQASAYKDNVSDNLKKLFWMTPPNQNYTLELDSLIKLMDLYNNYLISHSEINKISNCDIANFLPPTTDYFYDDNHFNELGAMLVAQKIFKCIDLIKH
jgi:lysophospholipase L1-like esterase